MAYYKVRIEAWCDWNPAESDLDDIAQAMGVGEIRGRCGRESGVGGAAKAGGELVDSVDAPHDHVEMMRFVEK